MIGEVVRFVYNTFILDRAEYAKICREINTNYSKYEGKTYAVHIGIILRIMDMITIIYI